MYLLCWNCFLIIGQGLGSRSGVSPPSAERILGHLERARTGCKPMFKVESMQRVLRIAQAACTDTQRGLYRNLFALLEEEEQSTNTSKTAPSTSKGRGRKAAASSSHVSGSSNTSNSYSSKHRSASNRLSLKELSDSSESSSEVSCIWIKLIYYFIIISLMKSIMVLITGRRSYQT